jgi:hypothetical protein
VSSIEHLIVSKFRHLQLYDPLLEIKRYRPVIVDFSDLLRGIPFAVGLFDAT